MPPKASDAVGIDVSALQGDLDWKQLAASRLRFAFARASLGADAPDNDKRFKANWEALKANGIIRGAYHVFWPGDDPLQQVQRFMETVTLEPGDLPPVLDVEETPKMPALPNSAWIEGVHIWLTEIEKRTGRRPIIYTNMNYWQKHLCDDAGQPPAWTARYPLWVASWDADKPTLPPGWTTYQFWQYCGPDCQNCDCNKEETPFVHFDRDYFNGTVDDLRAWVQKQSATTTPYTVQAGDTLRSIAARFNTTVDVLADLNPGLIAPGAVLQVPQTAIEAAEAPAPAEATPAEATPAETAAVAETVEAASRPAALPYVSQLEPDGSGYDNCGPSCLTMALAYHGWLPSSPVSLLREKMHAVSTVLKGQSWDALVFTRVDQMADALTQRGVPFRQLSSWDDIFQALDGKQAVILNLNNVPLQPRQYPVAPAFNANHFIVLYGYDDSDFLVGDPLKVVQTTPPDRYTRASVQAGVEAMHGLWALAVTGRSDVVGTAVFDVNGEPVTLDLPTPAATPDPDSPFVRISNAEIQQALESLGQSVNLGSPIIYRCLIAYRQGEWRGPAISDEYPVKKGDAIVWRQKFTQGIAEYDPRTRDVTWLDVVQHPEVIKEKPASLPKPRAQRRRSSAKGG